MNIQNLGGQELGQGQYLLQAVLGYGGMGVVYRGIQRNLERTVAIKILTPALSSEKGYIDRFYQEAKTAAALEHAHIGPVYDYGVQGDISYVVMRFLTGGTLADRMKQREEKENPLPSLGEVARMLTQLGSALDYAHARGVIHRDIKPSNVMFDDQGASYVVDFGIAKLMESTTSFTASNTPIGTPAYMPPEQWRSEPLTPAADQYALAITAYHVLTNALPFQTTTPYALLHAHLHEDPVPIHELRADLPLNLADAIQRALAKDPADRFPSASEFAAAFQDAAMEQSGEMTNFFTMPVGGRTPRTGTLPMPTPRIFVSGSDDGLVTVRSVTPFRIKVAVAGIAIVLLAVLALMAYVVFIREGSSSSLSAADQTQVAQNQTNVAIINTQEANRATEDYFGQQTSVKVAEESGRSTAFAEVNATGTADKAAQIGTETAAEQTIAAATQSSLNATATQNIVNQEATYAAFSAQQTESALQMTAFIETQIAEQTQVAEDRSATQDAANSAATVEAQGTATQRAVNESATQVAATEQSIALATESALLNATDAASTQAAFNQVSTANAQTATAEEALLLATEAALDQAATETAFDQDATATANFAATQGVINNTATASARQELATAAALDSTATSSARTAIFIAQITDTPTVTPTATVTLTPSATPTPSPVPTSAAQPDVRLVYDAEHFMITNISDEPVDLSGMTFALDINPNVEFPVNIWAQLAGANPANLEPGRCLYLITGAVPETDRPAGEDCEQLAGFVQSPAPSRYFWKGPDPNANFTLARVVRDELLGQEVYRQPIFSCPIYTNAERECTAALPATESCPGFMPSLLAVGIQVQSIVSLNNYVYATTDDTGERLVAIQTNVPMTVLDGPECADGTTWWEVEYEGETGWVVEGRGDRYWLIPYVPGAPSAQPSDAAATPTLPPPPGGAPPGGAPPPGGPGAN